MNTLQIVAAHAGADCITEAVDSWTGTTTALIRVGEFTDTDPLVFVADGREGLMPALQRGYESATYSSNEIIAFMHDDLIFVDNHIDIWNRVRKEFEDPVVGVVGFCGAKALGDPDLYQKPYQLIQLARRRVLSNLVDAEVHGERLEGSTDVVTLDGMALIVRRALLDKVGGWPINTAYDYINYDHWICLQARRHGFRVRVVGAKVNHLGGRTAVRIMSHLNTPERHAAAHVALYNDFRDQLPCEVA